MIGTEERRASNRKILSIADLPAIRERHRGQRIVLCHGAFDLIHVGHINHFEEAKALGDLLVVTVTADAFITKKRAVSFSEEYRLRQLAALEIVDYVALVNESSAVTPIEALHPDVYVKGPEYAQLVLDKTANIFREKAVIEKYGGRIRFTGGETFSSTKLAHFLLSAPEASQDNPLLRNDRILFRDLSDRGFRLEQLKEFLAAASRLRVCLIGETIIDEWVDVTVTNLSLKSRCVAGLERSRVRQVGGTGVIALHLADFVQHVDCFTNGPTHGYPANVRVTSLASGTLIKTRFVDQDNGYRLFEAKSPDLTGIDSGLPDRFDDYDAVLIADFGHGLIDATALNARIAARSRAFVAAMAQVNSSNYGYNLPTKYHGVDYVSLNRTEAELCLRERGLALGELEARVSRLLGAPIVSVTDGNNGVLVKKHDDVCALPTLSTSVVDTIGCGDAYFSLSSLAACVDLPASMIGLCGSIAAAGVAQRRGNDRPVSEQEFLTIGKIVI
jgi:rfaE bifunctional protein nucleotidyltransferase chain/domain